MRIGVPKETKTLEGRVALVPAAAGDLQGRIAAVTEELSPASIARSGLIRFRIVRCSHLIVGGQTRDSRVRRPSYTGRRLQPEGATASLHP